MDEQQRPQSETAQSETEGTEQSQAGTESTNGSSEQIASGQASEGAQTESCNTSFCACATSCCDMFSNFDLGRITGLVRDVFFKREAIWPEVKVEQTTVKEIYQNFYVWLALIPPVFGFIGTLTDRGHLLSPIGQGVATYLISLAMLLIMSYVLKFIGEQFKSEAPLVDYTKLIAISSIPSLVGGVFAIAPNLAFIGMLIGLLGIYLFYTGIPSLAGVGKEKQTLFFATSILAYIVIGVIFGTIFGLSVVAGM